MQENTMACNGPKSKIMDGGKSWDSFKLYKLALRRELDFDEQTFDDRH